MRILYGVQGTGNGHITRARAMATELRKAGADVDYLFSGREPHQFFDMEIFGNFRTRRGLTFTPRNGRIAPVSTLCANDPLRFGRDLRDLSLRGYDLVITDFEPVTAWAARLRKVPTIGLGHQYAFRFPVPRHRCGPIHRGIMRYFAPADLNLGLHWHHFHQPVLPPIAPVDAIPRGIRRGHYLVYLPFESTSAIDHLLGHFPEYSFSVYHPLAQAGQRDNIHWQRPGRDNFQADLHRCEGVICNAGFELASEILQLGRKFLVRPVQGQSEQYANALALDLLGYGHVMYKLDRARMTEWLQHARGTRIQYPDVARRVSRWIVAGDHRYPEELAQSLWAETRYPDINPATHAGNDALSA